MYRGHVRVAVDCVLARHADQVRTACIMLHKEHVLCGVALALQEMSGTCPEFEENPEVVNVLLRVG
jgi:hypothetical protein